MLISQEERLLKATIAPNVRSSNAVPPTKTLSNDGGMERVQFGRAINKMNECHCYCC